MTAQISDLFIYQNKELTLAGISEGELFIPESLGLKPVMASTACWRGYQAIYSLHDSQLVLKSLRIKLLAEGENGITSSIGPAIGEINPEKCPKSPFFNNIYNDIKIPLPYTGGLLLASGFIRDLYVHMGFHPAWKYEYVVELLFEKGRLLSTEDKSDSIKYFRDNIKNRSKSPPSKETTHEEIQEFVESAFSRHYR